MQLESVVEVQIVTSTLMLKVFESKKLNPNENAVLEFEMQNSVEGAGQFQTLTRAEYK